MNLFLLSKSARRSAKYQCNVHVNKMLLEAVQMLYTAWYVNRKSLPSMHRTLTPFKKIRNHNHPMARWVRKTKNNYRFALRHAFALAKEFYKRSKKKIKKEHACVAHLRRLEEWGFPEKETSETYIAKDDLYAMIDVPKGVSPFPLCFGKEREKYLVKRNGKYSAVYSYRSYYKKKEETMKTRFEYPAEKPDFLK